MGTVVLNLAGSYGVQGAIPGFRELNDGEQTVRVAVQSACASPGSASVLGARDVSVHALETLASIRTKLELEGLELLVECVTRLATGGAESRTLSVNPIRPAIKPTPRQVLDFAKRIPRSVIPPSANRNLLKTFLYLCFFYLGIFRLIRTGRRWANSSRAVILLFHRVNDISVEPLTTSIVAFAEFLTMLKKYYRVCSTSWLVERMKNKEPIPADTIVIHFDDCYRDVFQHAIPLLEKAGFPATFFISSGFIDKDRAFHHDVDCYPFSYENLKRSEVHALAGKGFEIGAHTVNHADLGGIPLPQAEFEVMQSRADLETITGKRVRFFAFPFGKINNISEESRKIIMESGFEALFSSYGGMVGKDCNLFDIPRRGVSSAHRPLDLLMEIEGLGLTDLMVLTGLKQPSQ
jgi:peptidoglycan/xylan/chitin deacetylase (PgdA/CDA1 family)